jgi:FAD/FMN-containing dehydrogenase
MTSTTVDRLAAGMKGTLFARGRPGYDEARRLWNGMIDKHPVAIARCASPADVGLALQCARDQGLAVSMRGGGHHVAGSALIDGGLVIDLSDMRSVTVDPRAGRARAGGGAQIGDVDRACQPFNVCVPLGVFTETGVGGITLAGGVGWLRRAHGMTCDNLVSAEVVLADGCSVTASADDHPELFWALRGGGWDFGVVTAFEYRTHPIPAEVAMLFVTYPIDEAVAVLRRLREFMASAPDAVSPLAVLWTFPHAEPYPREVWGRQFIALAGPYAGPRDEGERLFRPLRELGTVLLDMSAPMSYFDVQRLFDHEYPKGRRYYWKSSYLRALDDGAIDVLVEYGKNRPSPLSSVDVWTLGGAMARIGPEDTPIGQRAAPYMIGIEANWDDPAGDDANRAWTRDMARALEPFSTGGTYLNFEDVTDPRFVRASHGRNFERLVEIKRRYDPENLFRSRAGLVD